MLFGISLTVWIVMLVCAVIAVLYVLIVDKKEGKRAEKRKYLATVHPVLPVGGDFEWEVETGS